VSNNTDATTVVIVGAVSEDEDKDEDEEGRKSLVRRRHGDSRIVLFVNWLI